MAGDLRPLRLLYCDLGGFKAINGLHGHDVGDDVLKAVAERLRAVTRSGDTVARMGDEFAILLEDGGDAVAAVARIFEAFAQPASAGRQEIPLAASIGIAELSPSAPPVDPETFLQRADAAMYQAKRNGKNCAAMWAEEQLAPADELPSPVPL